MALAQNDEVAVGRNLSQETLAASGRVVFGLVQEVSEDAVDVLWQDGRLVQDIDPALLDKIVGINAPQDRVKFTDGEGGTNSPAYSGVIVRRYSRQRNGASTTGPFTLVRLDNGELVEVPTPSCVKLEGQ